jgi:uncharacterized protein (DUF433 family)
MSIEDAIVSDPDILGGVPVFRGTRVPVKNLFDYLNSGDSYTTFLADFDYIPKQQIIAVLESIKLNFTINEDTLASAA